MEAVRLVVLGGSGVATPELAAALHAQPGRRRPLEVVLVGRTPAKLETVAAAARLLAGGDPLLRISATTDMETALQGAQIVLNQVRVGGLEARAFDETFPHEVGLAGEETVGAGGFANASRTIPVVLEQMRVVERIAPEATVLTFANPSSLVQFAIQRYTRLNAVGMCDAPLTLIGNIANALGAEAGQIQVDYVGMHHFGWAVGVWKDGEDLLPRALAQAQTACPDVEADLTRALGVIPGAYLNYFFHPERMLAKKLGKRSRAEELLVLQDELLKEFEAAARSGQPPAGLAKRKAKWYQVIIAPVIHALVEGGQERRILNVANRGTLPWLPYGAIIETLCQITQGRVEALPAPQAPAFVQAMVARNCAYEFLAVEAIVERNREKAIQALMLNPLIQTYAQARFVLEKAWSWRAQ